MLFDLQSPRRRRVVRVVFGGLALIFAISFVFLGVGTGGGGFSFSDLFGGGSSSSSSTAFDGDIDAAQAKLTTNPNDTATLATLVQLHYSAANSNTDANGVPSSDGVQHLREAADAWNKYVKASKGDLNPNTAAYALNVFDLLARIDFSTARTDTSTAEALADVNAAVDDWKGAAQAQQVRIEKLPKVVNSNSYATLAQYLYLAGDTKGGDRAAAQAKTAKGASDPATLDKQLQQFSQLGQQLQTAIKQLNKQQQSQGAAGGGATGGGATGGAGGSNPLNGLGTGGLSGGGGL